MDTHPEVWIGTSWKMNKTLAEALAFAEALRGAMPDPRIQRFVIPPFTAVRDVKAALATDDVKVGAQNMHWDDAGAWTGEVSAPMLVDCRLDMVELGHSERRAHFGETDAAVGRKAATAVRHGLAPLICIGEQAEDKAAGRADTVLARQVEAALGPLADLDPTVPVLLAYEPVWAIGAGGTPAAPEYAEDRHAAIAEVARGLLGRSVPCLYGGSVTADNCTDLITQAHIDGLFIGRAAWDVGGYLDILDRCAKALSRGKKE